MLPISRSTISRQSSRAVRIVDMVSGCGKVCAPIFFTLAANIQGVVLVLFLSIFAL